jgi:ribosomal protein S6
MVEIGKSVYELVFMFQAKTTPERISSFFRDLLSPIKELNEKNELLYSEYWGLRHLAYEISDSKQAHYYMLRVSTKNPQNILNAVKKEEFIIRHYIENISSEIDDVKSPSHMMVDLTKKKDDRNDSFINAIEGI